jgi:hypothetical protein
MRPRRYEFHISGRLCPDVRSAFGDLHVSTRPKQTIIRGRVDGTKLSDVLALLRNLGIRLVSVRQLPDLPQQLSGRVREQSGTGSAERPQ